MELRVQDTALQPKTLVSNVLPSWIVATAGTAPKWTIMIFLDVARDTG